MIPYTVLYTKGSAKGATQISYKNAGKLVRGIGWFHLISGLLLVKVFIIIFLFVPGRPDPDDPAPFVGTLMVFGMSVLYLKVGKAIGEHEEWGRRVGMALGVFLLLHFPVGTLFGHYIVWCLMKGWDPTPFAPTSNKREEVSKFRPATGCPPIRMRPYSKSMGG